MSPSSILWSTILRIYLEDDAVVAPPTMGQQHHFVPGTQNMNPNFDNNQEHIFNGDWKRGNKQSNGEIYTMIAGTKPSSLLSLSSKTIALNPPSPSILTQLKNNNWPLDPFLSPKSNIATLHHFELLSMTGIMLLGRGEVDVVLVDENRKSGVWRRKVDDGKGGF